MLTFCEICKEQNEMLYLHNDKHICQSCLDKAIKTEQYNERWAVVLEIVTLYERINKETKRICLMTLYGGFIHVSVNEDTGEDTLDTLYKTPSVYYDSDCQKHDVMMAKLGIVRDELKTFLEVTS